MRLLFAYLAPVYLAFALLYHPDSAQPLLKLTWALLLVIGFLASVRWCVQPTPSPPSLNCPNCATPNAPERLLCHHCYAELYTLDAHGNLVSTSQNERDHAHAAPPTRTQKS